MDHVGILKRVWQMLWRYRALWVFGIILALTAGSGSGASNGSAQFGGGGGGNGQGFEFTPPAGIERELEHLEKALEQFFATGNWAPIIGGISALILALCCLGFLLAIGTTVARFVSETAVIRMVDHYEATGEKKTVGQGFRLGWSRAAWRLFLIRLVVTLPIVIGAILLFGLAGLPLLTWTMRNTAVGVFGTIVTIGLSFLVVLALIAVSIVATVLVRLAWRATALDNQGVFEAIQRSWALIWGHLGDVGLMWLIMVGINLGYSVLMIPVVLILLIVAGITGGLVFGTLLVLVRLFASGALPWIVGAALGAPIFFVMLLVPLLSLEALRQIYQSGVWTLTYRELTALDVLAVESDEDENDAEAEPGPR